MSNKNKKGFTLVELSIVIIIIGFLIAGIAAGNSLIKQAKLNTVISEQQTYLAALNAFKDRYGYYPGDFSNAEAYWPTTVSGDGDGIIILVNEGFQLWEHLIAANMISANTDNGITNEPLAKFSNDTIWRVEGNACGMYTIPALTKNSLQFQTALGTDVLTSTEAFQIDNKVDDGKPSDGKVYAMNNNITAAIVEADGVTPAESFDCGGGNYNSKEAKYNFTYATLGISRMYFYLPE